MTILLPVGLWAAGIALYDWRQQRVPNAALILMLVPALLALLLQPQGLLGAGRVSAVLGMLAAFALSLPGYGRGLGAGDVKFAAVLGLLLGGWRALEMLLLAAVLLGLSAAVVAYWRRSLQARFPAAPALSLAFVLEMLRGPFLEGWLAGW